MGPAELGPMAEPGPVPPSEKLCAAKYNVVMSAGLILPDGRELDSDGHIPRFREEEKGEKKGAERRKSPRMIYVLLCRHRNKSSVVEQRGEQAIKHRITSELVPPIFFKEKPQMSSNVPSCQKQSLCFMSSRPLKKDPFLRGGAWPPVCR